MKRYFVKLIAVILTLFTVVCANAQDIIIKKNGEEIQAKVEEVGTTEVKYRKFGNEASPLYAVLKSELFMIKYENGSKDVFDLSVTSDTAYTQPVRTVSAPVEQPQEPSKTKSKKSNSKWGYKKNAFEFDVTFTHPPIKMFAPGFSIGFGWLNNCTRYFAWDIFSLHVSNSFKGFDAGNTGLILWTGPKIYFLPITEKVVPFLALRYGVGTTVHFENISHSFSPELGVNLTHKFYLSFGYAHSWGKSTNSYQVQESYITGYKQIYLYSTKKYESFPIYGTRDVTKTETHKYSSGILYLRFGFNF